MKNTIFLLFFFINVFHIFAQEQTDIQTLKPNYRLASKYSPTNLGKMVHSTQVSPNWLTKGNRFWYQYKTTEGTSYNIIDADKRSKTKLFDNAKMAKWISEITKDPYDAKHLPRFKFQFVKNETAIRFRVTSNEEVEAKEEKKDTIIKDSSDAKKKKPKMEKKVYHLEYQLRGNSLTIIDNEKEDEERAKWASVAPDSTIVLFAKKHNLYWMDKENFLKALENEEDSTIVEHQWTKDGVEHFGYGRDSRGSDNVEKEKNKDDRKRIGVMWSHDSKKFVYQKSDSRKIKDLWLVNSAVEGRPTLETYKYHMAGEQEFPLSNIEIFDVATKAITKVKLDTTVQQNISIYRHHYKKSRPKEAHSPTLLLSKKGKIYFNTLSRDRKRLDIHVADINTGKTKTIIEERSNVYIETRGRPFELFNNETEIIHWSERDGWGHLYLFDNDGNLKSQITNGEYHTDQVEGINENGRIVYFTAQGVPNNQDPYYTHLYKINLNGTGLKSLNPGDFNSSVSVSDSKSYFVCNYSTVNSIPKSELRNSSGGLVMSLEEADLSQLFKSGYKFPEPFKVKADDGITDIYGVIYKPFDFDENKKYPLLEYVYPGPQTEAVSKSFSMRMNRTDRMAQVGFVVITLGNRGGHPQRSKWYHTYGYGNLRDYGLADKKYVAEQLADKYNFIDIKKVGIFGHSGGGFMSTAAMLVYPDFFKAAVSSSGNHDNSIYNSWWSETHHGIKEEKDEDGSIKYKYLIDNNQSLAKNLKGNLMLATGDADNNVHPGGTIKMVNALIKANKRFDFVLFPGQRHGYGDMTEYFFWKKADYFSKHLLGIEPTSIDVVEMNRDIPIKK